MREEQKKQFFAIKSGTQHTSKVGGNFSFKALSKDVQEEIKKKLANKDEVMAKALKGDFPGLKIDGRQVTRENLHEFEKQKTDSKKEKKVESKYVKEDLEKLSFSKLKKIAEKLGETGRSKSGLIKDILKHN